MRSDAKIRLMTEERIVLEARCREPTTSKRDAKRAWIILMAAAGYSTRVIAREVGVPPRIASLWRQRFADRGLSGLRDLPRSGRTPVYTEATGKRILALLHQPPPPSYARWTCRLLSAALGDVSGQYVWRFLQAQRIDANPGTRVPTATPFSATPQRSR